MSALPLTFSTPWVLLVLPILWWWLLRPAAPGPRPILPFGSELLLENIGTPVRAAQRRTTAWLPSLIATCLVLASAGPHLRQMAEPTDAEGIDVLLLVDASRSMDTRDYDTADGQSSRLEALRRIVANVVKARPQDRLGVLAFAEKPYLVSPLTLDHSWVEQALATLETTLGTAIGSSIEAGVDLLAAGKGRSRVMILLTDGLNTSGADPLAASRLAAQRGIRIYPIELVTYGELKSGELDQHPLAVIAKNTGGQFFQAPDATALEGVYAAINTLERNRLRELRQVDLTPIQLWPLLAALVLLLAHAVREGRRPHLP